MKKLILFLLVVAVGVNCRSQEKRFFTSSALIDDAKELVKEYENQDWEGWKKHYTSDAEFYHNDWENAATADEFMQLQKDLLSEMSEYEFVDDPIFYEHIIDDDGKDWVYFWGVWKGTFKGNNETLRIPVHLALLYEDGKITEEYGFYDMSNYLKKMQEMED